MDIMGGGGGGAVNADAYIGGYIGIMETKMETSIMGFARVYPKP